MAIGALGSAARVAALALGALVAACGASEPPGPPPVLLLVVDATHAAHLGHHGGHPDAAHTIDALGSRGVRFERAFSNANWTLPSTGCLFTGTLQERHGAVTREHRVDASLAQLPELFAAAGYRTAGFVQMAYASAHYGYGKGFEHYRYYGAGADVPQRRTVEDALAWLRTVEGEPWFAYVHVRRPHSPYNPPPAVLERFDPDGDPGDDAFLRNADVLGERELPPAQLDRLEALYRANLATADAELRPLVTAALDAGALVVVTSDHGESLGRRGVFGHGQDVHAENVDVPLVVAGPGVAQGVDRDPVCTVDVLPTLVEWCDLDAPPQALDGESFAARLRGERAGRGAAALTTDLYGLAEPPEVGVVEGDLKLVLRADGTAALFDRSADPLDRVDLAAARPGDAERLRAIAEAWRAEHAAAAERPTAGEQVDDAVLRDLEALGYAGHDGGG